MGKNNNLEILTTAFSALPKEDRKRLKYHLDKGTKVFSGKHSDYGFFNSEGFG